MHELEKDRAPQLLYQDGPLVRVRFHSILHLLPRQCPYIRSATPPPLSIHELLAMRALPRRRVWSAPFFTLLTRFSLLSLLLSSARAAFITFENCLPESTVDSDPQQLQFTPYWVDASFLSDHRFARSLNLTVYGNVSGQQFTGDYPPADSPQWRDKNDTFGKIANVGTDNKYATLTADYDVVTYTAHHNRGQEFCATLVNGTGSCPLGPSFDANRSDPNTLPAFSVNQPFNSSYAFSTISTTLHLISGDVGGANMGCISVQITPDLGKSIVGLLTWLPAVILILKGVATLAAAIWSPWGSEDIFRWSSNYGRDEDLLRLVTPGFGDCLQYIQFIVLTGSLTLQYPGFFRPAVSQASWSTLMFNHSFVNGGSTQSLVDGLYSTNATYGLTRMSQLVGLQGDSDIWAGMAIWLLVIAAVVVALCQLGFVGRWLFHMATQTTEEDLRQKNLPFTLGNIIRLLFNFFILPIVALSLFQLVIWSRSPISVSVCAVILLLIMVVWAGWILRFIFKTKPRTLLFDDMPIVLLYGPLYNTYSDSAAPFALVPVFITFVRGVAIGAIQPSGIAQIIVLAICEVILILTLNGFRPFQGQTSMNLYHTFFATIRLVTILLMIAFMPSLGVTEAPKGWIGYVILLLHACVLIFGFFLNSMQTLIEVVARSMGAGGDKDNGAVRGSILNWRALKKRPDRTRDAADRGSMMSSAAILGANTAYGTRSRSISASSQQLLNRMSGFENFSQGGEVVSSPDVDVESANQQGHPMTSGGTSTSGVKIETDGYYRPPRPRKTTIETLGGTGARNSGTGDFPYLDSPTGPSGHARDASYDSNAFGSPAPAYIRNRTGSNDETARYEPANRTDYAVREVDQYYRGPALNEQATRKLKTGPADPTGPASTAQSWLNKLIFGVKGGKTKDQGKGFEVVRSARAPPGMSREPEDGVEMTTSPGMHQELYQDMPDTPASPTQAVAGAERSMDDAPDSPATPAFHSGGATAAADMMALDSDPRQTGDSFDFEYGNVRDSVMTGHSRPRPNSDALGMPVLEPITFEHADSIGVAPTPPRRASDASTMGSVVEAPGIRYSDQPVPMLAPIERSPSIALPSRFNSTASRFTTNQQSPTGVLSDGSAPSRLPASRSAVPNNADMVETAGGSDWLRAVDSLSWGDHSRQTSVRSSQQAQSSQYMAPSVPRRSSRRPLSQDVGAGGTTYQAPSPNVFEGFDSNGSTPDVDDRPRQGSMAKSNYVSHHRAQDSISRNSIGAAAALREGSASVEYGTPPAQQDDYLGSAGRLL